MDFTVKYQLVYISRNSTMLKFIISSKLIKPNCSLLILSLNRKINLKVIIQLSNPEISYSII